MSTNTSSPESRVFGPGQPSRTSIVVAALRAFGAREPDDSVRNPDFLAERMVTTAELQLISEHPISSAFNEDYQKGRQNREVAGMSNLMLVRTRFIDERMKRALDEGAAQVVILGAGFDTRAYRFKEQLGSRIVFEVDYQSTQAVKKRRIIDVFGTLPEHVRFVEIDFQRDTLHEALQTAGYDARQKTFFIWEGVSMYLQESAVRETLRTISEHSAPGSTLVMDFAEQAIIDMLKKLPHLSQHNYTTHWGEPWIFGVPDMREREFFRECGLELRELLSCFGPEAVKRYLTRADGTRLGTIRGGPPRHHAVRTILRVLWMLISRRTRWYALAELTTPVSSRRKY